jgi:hypothetical protein
MLAIRSKIAQIIGLSYLNPFLGLYVAYGLVQVNQKTVDKSCGRDKKH